MKFLKFWYHFLKNLLIILKQSYYDLGRVQLIVTFRTWFRYLFLAVIFRKTKRFDLGTGETVKVAKNTIDHNLKGLQLAQLRGFSGFRPDKLLRTISVIERIDIPTAKILFIGPRAESELFLARSYGFKKRNARGLDLISYSNKVDLGDMHNMPYEANSWDVVVMGWVIAYSNDPRAAAKEVVRVAKNGAVISVGVQYHPLSVNEVTQMLGYTPGADKRIESTKAILGFFEGFVDHVYFEHIVAKENAAETGELLVTFSIKK
jgi:hypothetical protein